MPTENEWRNGCVERRASSAVVVGLACILALQCAACDFVRILRFNIPHLDAPGYFAERAVRPSSHPILLDYRVAPVDFPMRQSRSESYRTFEDLLSDNDTRAFVVLAHDEIVYEQYFGTFTEDTLLPCFSASKTFAAVLVGCALEDGLIPSVDARLDALVPEVASHPGYGSITLDQLLRMTSGIDFAEDSTAGAALYYTEDLHAAAFSHPIKYPPGQHYEYGTVSVQLAWEVLHKKLGAKTVASYFEERVWDRIGAEHGAEWALDSAEHGVEKLGAGFSATARDYARLGLLFKHRGRAGGREVVAERWVEKSLAVDEIAGVVHTTDGSLLHGRYQWFLTLDGSGYFAKGYNGQYVYVDRARDVVIVRFGEGYGDVDWLRLFASVAATL